MSDSPTEPKTPRERAFDIYEASGGRIGNDEIVAHLHQEGHDHVNAKTLSAWKTRDNWARRVPKGSKAKGVIALQRLLLAPKVEKMVELNRVEKLGEAGDDIVATATVLAGKLRTRVDNLDPDEIAVKEIGLLIESVGTLLEHAAAIDAEVVRRKGEIAKQVDSAAGPKVIDHEDLSPAQIAARDWAAARSNKK